MKLLNSNLSPFATRPRLAIFAKRLPVTIEPANLFLPDGSKDPNYLAINPIGLVPTLILDDGTAIPESQVIVEYLADAFPESRLLPDDANRAARARLLARIVEHYVQAPSGSMFMQLFASDRDQDLISSVVASMDKGLQHLNHFMTDDHFAVGDTITLADCALVPYLFFYAERLLVALDRPPMIDKYARVAGYWHRVQTNDSVKRVIAEMNAGLANSRLRMMATSPS